MPQPISGVVISGKVKWINPTKPVPANNAHLVITISGAIQPLPAILEDLIPDPEVKEACQLKLRILVPTLTVRTGTVPTGTTFKLYNTDATLVGEGTISS